MDKLKIIIPNQFINENAMFDKLGFIEYLQTKGNVIDFEIEKGYEEGE